MRSLPRAAQLYVGAVVLVASAVVIIAILHQPFSWLTLGVLIALNAVCESSQAVIRRGRMSLSVSSSISLAAVFLTGPWGAALIGPSHLLSVDEFHLPAVKRVFNVAQSTLCGWLAGLAYQWTPGHAEAGFGKAVYPAVFIAVLVAILVDCLVNWFLLAVVLRLVDGTPILGTWWSAVAGYASTQMGYSIIGLLMAVLWAGGAGPLAAILILLPLLIARWAIQQHADEYAAYEATIRSLVRAVEAKDLYTRGHSERVSKASVLIAHQIAMREDRVDALRYAGILHDVGKLGVPTSVLRKSGKLSADEFDAIKQHPVLGLEMVHNIDFLAEAHAGILHHHERMDGRGYPHGLVGDQIPEFARVIAVADAFDAMTSTRSYRDARPVDEALEELKRWAGTQFDPVMVQALVTAVERHGWKPAEIPEQIRRPARASVLADHDDPAVANGEISEGAELTSLP
jgi:hypothetical protein